MLTDDDLTRDLRVAFHDAADDLTYDGPVPAARTTPVWAQAGWLALPAAAAVAAVAVVATGPGTEPGAPPSAAPSTTAPRTGDSPAATVTDTIEFAGYTMTYRRSAGTDPARERSFSPDSVPDGAREVTFPEMSPARAWVGTDPATGDPTLYLDAPTRNDGHLMGLSVPGFDEDDLVDLLRNGRRD